MDNVFCNDISRSSLGTKDDCDRTLWQFAFLDLKIFIDHIEGVHLLSLVFMQTLDLDVKDRIRVNGNVLCLF